MPRSRPSSALLFAFVAAALCVLGGLAVRPAAVADVAADDGYPFRHPAYAAYAAADGGLRRLAGNSPSGLVGYRVVDDPAVAGFLEPSEGVVGACGGRFYAAVPLDTGTDAGIAGWLLYRPGETRHVAVIDAPEWLEFRDDHLRTSRVVADPLGRARRVRHRIDVLACRDGRFPVVGTKVTTEN